MIYVDTSVIVKLYIKEKYSKEAADWLKSNNKAIPLTLFHELEFNNALNLKKFRAEITNKEISLILRYFVEHKGKGIFYHPPINWTDTFKYALELSTRYTGSTGSRSLDILHVALALTIQADKFLTFDKRQSELAAISGMMTEFVI